MVRHEAAAVEDADRVGQLVNLADVPDLPRTNNALEQLFGSQRYHERRATGRKTASPGAVLRGAVRFVAVIATRA